MGSSNGWVWRARLLYFGVISCHGDVPTTEVPGTRGGRGASRAAPAVGLCAPGEHRFGGSVDSRRRHRHTHRRAEVCCPRLRRHEVRRRRRRTRELHRSDRQGHRRLPCRRRRPRRHTRRPLPYWRDQARVRREPSPRAEGDARFQQRLAGVSNGLHALGRHRADEPLGVHLRVRGGEHRRHRHWDARRPG